MRAATRFSRDVQLVLERQRLEELARSRGYENTAHMLHDLYVVQKIPIETLAFKVLFTPLHTLRKRLFEELHIVARPRGGKHDGITKLEISQELVREVSRDGLTSVSERLGISSCALRFRLLRWIKKNKP